MRNIKFGGKGARFEAAEVRVFGLAATPSIGLRAYTSCTGSVVSTSIRCGMLVPTRAKYCDRRGIAMFGERQPTHHRRRGKRRQVRDRFASVDAATAARARKVAHARKYVGNVPEEIEKVPQPIEAIVTHCPNVSACAALSKWRVCNTAARKRTRCTISRKCFVQQCAPDTLQPSPAAGARLFQVESTASATVSNQQLVGDSTAASGVVLTANRAEPFAPPMARLPAMLSQRLKPLVSTSVRSDGGDVVHGLASR